MVKHHIYKRGVLMCASLFFGLVATAQVFQAESVSSAWHVVRENAQKTFPKTVAAGNYSGITHLHDDIYAVVSDKSEDRKSVV